MRKIDLNGKWELRSSDSVEICEGNVPSCNYTDLFKAGIIEDPILGDNEEKLQWISEKTWEYSRIFEVVKEDLNLENIIIVFEQIDTLSTVYINEKIVGETASAHIKYEFDIKPFLKQGENLIKVVFHPPFDKIKKLQKDFYLPKRVLGESGNPHLRYPQYHFGWDWGPHFVSCGMSRDAYILAYKDRIFDVLVKQQHIDEKVKIVVSALSEKSLSAGFFEGEILGPSGKVIPLVFSGNEGKCLIEKPELWWCNGLGAQPLYKVIVRLKNADEVNDIWEKYIGLRQIVLSKKEDSYGSDFCFIVNGERIFARGSNWIPTDIFIAETSLEKLEFLVRSARDANMNMLRVWGGGYYERDAFYDLCDKYGILVWQDLMFACTPFQWYRQDFYNLTIKELEDNVQRIRHHASLALWCGNNEIEALSTDWKVYKPGLVEDLKKYFYEDIPNRLKKLDPDTDYWATSPGSGIPMEDMDSDNVGDTHIWAVWHGLQRPEYYNKRKTRFCSEFGMQSMPSMNAIDIFAPESGVDLKSHTMLLHQKCMSGNKKMKYYINQMFWAPKKIQDYVYLSQVVQSECMETATVGWRLMKDVCNGAIVWQYNDCWGASSWAGIDYYNNFKALQYRSKHFNCPVAAFPVLESNQVIIKGINDTLKDIEVVIKYHVGEVNSGGKVFIRKTILPTKQINDIAVIRNEQFLKKENTYILVVLEDTKGNEIMRKGLFVSKTAARNLLKDEIKYEIRKENEFVVISLKTEVYKRFIELRIKGENTPFSDNYFDMYPGEQREILIKTDLSEEEFKARINISSLSDVEPGHSRFHDKIEMCKTFLIPINFLSYLYHTFMI